MMPTFLFLAFFKIPLIEGVIISKLGEENFFTSTEKIQDLAIVKYDLVEFSSFKNKIKPILICICEGFLKD